MATATRTRENTTVIDCPKCRAPHFNYQLTCKRCGDYLHRADVVATGGGNALVIAGGLTAVSTVVLAVCAIIHAF